MIKKVILCGFLLLSLHLSLFAQQLSDFEWYGDFDETVITSYTGTSTAVTIPRELNGRAITTIDDNAFANKGLTSIIIPDTVKYIRSHAFANNQLTKLSLPNSVYDIWDGAFANNRLTGVTIPDSVVYIGDGAFARNQLTDVTISGSIGIIESAAFAYNLLTSVVIPGRVLKISYAAFAYNPLTSVTIGADVWLTWEVLGSNDSFDQAYISGGSLAGTYTRPNAESTVWTRR